MNQIKKIKTTKTIEKENWGVHETHCCAKHGCKYGDEDCPVVIGFIKQKYDCEDCIYEREELSRCKYCGFSGTDDEMMEHAGKCEIMLKDNQPEDIENNIDSSLVVFENRN